MSIEDQRNSESLVAAGGNNRNILSWQRREEAMKVTTVNVSICKEF